MDIIAIKHATCSAQISLQGGQLLQWQPTSYDTPVLWCNRPSSFVEGQPIRGGVPICWPWFAGLGQPSHGFARLMEWKLHKLDRNDEYVIVKLSLTDSEETRALWPFEFNLTQTLYLGEECHIELDIECQEPTTGALHSYFYTEDVYQCTVNGLGNFYRGEPKGADKSTQADQLTILPPIDRIYTQPEAQTQLYDASNNRTIIQDHMGHSDIVVWNPGHHMAPKDIKAADADHFVCIETARISKSLTSKLAVHFSIKFEDD